MLVMDFLTVFSCCLEKALKKPGKRHKIDFEVRDVLSFEEELIYNKVAVQRYI